MTVRFYSSTATPKNLVSSITSGNTVIQVSDTTGLPAQFPYTLALDYETPVEELVDVTAAAGTTLTITRAVDGTSATSHTAGAVVRHVSSARDFTDSRNHENSSTNVHGTGVGSAVVGTTDTQTLTNKTISGAAFTGTISGNPTFSGNPSFTGGPTFSGTQSFTTNTTFTGEIDTSNLIRSARASATDSLIEGRMIGDTDARWLVRENGDTLWGPGNATQDTVLQRTGASQLHATGSFFVQSNGTGVITHLGVNTAAGVNPASLLFDARNNGTSVLNVTPSGTLSVAPVSTTADAIDVNLPSGSTADAVDLKLNGTTKAAIDGSGAFRIYQGNAPFTYTPTVTGGGSATFSTNTGYYYEMGPMVFVVVYLVVGTAGSGTGFVQLNMPTVVDRSARQIILAHGEGVGGVGGNLTSSHLAGGEGVFFTGGTGAILDRIRFDKGGAAAVEDNMLGADLIAGANITLQGWYRSF